MDRNERHYLRFVISRLPNLLLAVCYGNGQRFSPNFGLVVSNELLNQNEQHVVIIFDLWYTFC